MRKIVRIEDLGDPKWYGGSFNVWFEGADEPLFCHKVHLDLLKYENEMLQLGISSAVIENHKDLVIAHVQEEISLEGECA